MIYICRCVGAQMQGMMDKSRDQVYPDLEFLMGESTDPLVRSLSASEVQKQPKSGSKKNLGTQFCADLQGVMTKLKATTPHFIKVSYLPGIVAPSCQSHLFGHPCTPQTPQSSFRERSRASEDLRHEVGGRTAVYKTCLCLLLKTVWQGVESWFVKSVSDYGTRVGEGESRDIRLVHLRVHNIVSMWG